MKVWDGSGEMVVVLGSSQAMIPSGVSASWFFCLAPNLRQEHTIEEIPFCTLIPKPVLVISVPGLSRGTDNCFQSRIAPGWLWSAAASVESVLSYSYTPSASVTAQHCISTISNLTHASFGLSISVTGPCCVGWKILWLLLKCFILFTPHTTHLQVLVALPLE